MISARGRHSWGASVTVLFAGAAKVLGEGITAAAGNASAGSIIFALVRMIGALVLVIALFAGGLWLFKNWQRFVVNKGQAPKLTVLEVKSLGHRQALYVVGYEQQRLLLASSPAGVTMVTSLPPSISEAPSDNVVVPQPNFTDVLLHALNRKS